MQEQKNNEDTLTDDAIEAGIEELTLVLLYLKRFKWNHDDQVARASWRSFARQSFAVLRSFRL